LAHVYAALILLKAGKKPTSEDLKRILEVAGISVPESDVNALLTLIEAVKVEETPKPNDEEVERRLEKLEEEVRRLSTRLEEAVSMQSMQPRISTSEKPIAKEGGGGDVQPLKPSQGEQMEVLEQASEARYVYCVACNGGRSTLGRIGLDGCEVYTIPYRDICAVVHACRPEPYKSDERKTVEGWVAAHEEVVEKALELYGTVAPVTFNTIVNGGDSQVEEWLKKEYSRLKTLLEKLQGKDEYGIQIFLNSSSLKEELEKELAESSRELEGKPGTAYFYRQKIEKTLKDRMEAKIKALFEEFYTAIRACVEDIHVGKVKESEGEIMIANLSVLVKREKLETLKKILGDISGRKGVRVRFTGPWPPYSFVG
jgi:hypothetical protein